MFASAAARPIRHIQQARNQTLILGGASQF